MPNLESQPLPKAHKASQRQAQILEAAYAEFSTQGFRAARIEDIAKQARVSKGTIYLYFPTKEALFEALVRRDVAPKVAMIAERLKQHQGSLRPLLDQGIELLAYLIAQDKVPIYPKLLMAEAARFPQLALFYRQEVVEVMLKALEGQIQAAIERGELNLDNARMGAHLFIAPILKVIMWHFTFGATDPDPLDVRQYLKAHVAHFFQSPKTSPLDAQSGGALI